MIWKLMKRRRRPSIAEASSFASRPGPIAEPMRLRDALFEIAEEHEARARSLEAEEAELERRRADLARGIAKGLFP